VYTKLVLRLPQSPRAHQEPPSHLDHLGAVKLQEEQARTPSLDLSTQLGHVCTLKLLLTKKEHLNEEEEKPKWQEHALLLSLAAMDLQSGKRQL
jgi:hypothetical protein